MTPRALAIVFIAAAVVALPTRASASTPTDAPAAVDQEGDIVVTLAASALVISLAAAYAQFLLIREGRA